MIANDVIAEDVIFDYKRDRWGRPMIVPADGGKAKPYTRSSSAAKTIEDTYNLELYARRNVVYGMARDASLVARVLAIGGDPSTWGQPDKNAVNGIAEDAAKVAQAHRAADIGTALHKILEKVDRGETIDAGPYEADVNAYVEAMRAAGFVTRPEWVECRMACDDLAMAGTADRIVVDGNGLIRIADLKTGATVDYGALGWAAQLAAYARGQLYDVATDRRIATPTIDTEVGYIIHLPAGQGRCAIYELDLVAGYEAANLANEIRATRKAAKRWIKPLAADAPPHRSATPAALAPGSSPDPAPPAGSGDTFSDSPPSADDRRLALRARYTALSDAEKWAYIAKKVNGDDLDAVEKALDEIDPFAVVVPLTPVERPRPQRRPVTIDDLDQGAEIPDGDFDAMRAAVKKMTPDQRSWIENIVATSGGASVPIKGLRMRSFDLLRGIVALARAGLDNDELLREIAATVLGDDAPFFANTVGQAVGVLGAPLAARFADICVALSDNVDVELRSRPAA